MHTGFVYIWFDRKKKMFYIGSHMGTTDDGYISSSSWMNRAYKKRPGDFRRRIIYLHSGDKKSLHEVEQKWMNKIEVGDLGIRYYNFKKQAAGGHGACSEITKAKMRVIMKGKNTAPKSAAHKKMVAETFSKDWLVIDPEGNEYQVKSLYKFCKEKKISTGIYQNKVPGVWRAIRLSEKQSPETCQKISQATKGNQNFIGKKHSEESKAKIALAATGIIFSEERKENISIARQGLTQTERTKKKIAESVSRTRQSKFWSSKKK